MNKLSNHSLAVAFMALLLVLGAAVIFNPDSREDNRLQLVSRTENQPTTTLPITLTTAAAQPATRLTVGQENGPAPIGIGDIYMALGDSIAYGVGAPTPPEQGYAGLFYNNYLRRAKPDLQTYKNLAVPGETSASIFEGRRGNKSQWQKALDEIDAAKASGKVVSPITLTLGGNDMLENRQSSEGQRATALSRFEKNLSRAVDELVQKTGGRSDIILTTYYNPYIALGPNDEETSWVKRFNETIRSVAETRKARVADFFTPLFQQEGEYTWIMFGDVHPTGPGYSLLAQSLWRTSGYDREGPTLSLSFSGITNNRKLLSGERIAFKLAAADNIASDRQAETPGAGSITGATYSLDGGTKISMPFVPVNYLSKKSVPEFSTIIDTTGLAAGSHLLRFEAKDTAGITSLLEITLEVTA
jgi:lysophospholipase L1-like esterase